MAADVERVLSREETRERFGDTSIYVREQTEGVFIGVTRMLYTVRLWVGNELTWDKGFCYSSEIAAVAAAAVWDGSGDPEVGWHRELQYPFRRRTDGDPEQEYNAP